MTISAAGVAGAPVVGQAQQLVQQTGQQLQEFEQVLAQLQQQPDGNQLLAQAAGSPGGPPGAGGAAGVDGAKAAGAIDPTTGAPPPATVVGAGQAEGIYAQKVQEAGQPGGVEKLLGQVEAGCHRLEELLGEIQSGKTFSAQELLGLQGEMHQISLQVEVTTKVVGEVVSSVKQLMQQQI